MLEELGLGEARSQEAADVIVFNTCTVREKPDQRFAAHIAQARALKKRDPEKVIAVGGCYAEAQRERIFELYPEVDVAFGPGSISHLADWVGAGGQGIARGRFAEWTEFAAELPVRRERRFQAWVQISMGCNSKCAYCIVPAVRGREQSRRPGDIVAEVSALARDGVREVTLLGQNVNSWGRDLLPELKTEFGELLRTLDGVDGIERIRFTSPHPKDFRDPVIAAMAECESVCEHIHLPLQSGSTRILKAMRRTYTRERYLALVDKLRSAIPDLALTTDVIVGFPGESEADFAQTLEVVRGGRLRRGVHVRVQPAKRHRGGDDARPGAGRGQGGADRATHRGRSGARCARGMPNGLAASSRCSSRAQAGPIRRSCGGAHAGTRPSTSAETRRLARWSTFASRARRRQRCGGHRPPSSQPDPLSAHFTRHTRAFSQ